MSHAATNWAIQQRGLRPAAKVVLWHLCDRYNPDFGCFPNQDLLANDCEMSRSSINDQLKTLEDRGLILRERRKNETTGERLSTRYRFPFEHDFPCPESGHGSMSENDQNPCPDSTVVHVRNSDTNLVKEPVREPVKEREAREKDFEKKKDPNERRRKLAAFKRTFAAYPTFVSDSQDAGEKEWFKLSDDEQQEAEKLLPTWIAETKATGRKRFPAFAVFIRERLWQRLPEKTELPSTKLLQAKPHGKLFGVYRLCKAIEGPIKNMRAPSAFLQRQIDAGGQKGEQMRLRHLRLNGYPEINAMHENASEHRATSVPVEYEQFAEMTRRAPADGELVAAWRDEHSKRGWPWPDDLPDWLWLPAIDDETLDAKELVKATIKAFEEKVIDVGKVDDAAKV